MPLVELKCTNCGADIQIESSLEKAYCSYCGAQFIVSEILDKTVVINDERKIEPLLTLSSMAYDSGDYQKCIEYADNIIIIQPNNPEAWYLKGCASEESGTGNPTECFLKSSLFTNDDNLKKKINEHISGTTAHKEKTKNLKITVYRGPFLFQPFVNIYIDKQLTCKIKCGDCDVIKVPEGKHEFSIKQNGNLFSSWKQSIIFDEDNELMIWYQSHGFVAEFKS